MGIIVLFFPAILSLYFDMHINKRKELNKFDIFKYLIYCYFINFVGNFCVWIISTEKYYFYTSTTFTYDFCVKYMLITSIISLLLPIIFKVLIENIKISITVKEKNNDKKNSK